LPRLRGASTDSTFSMKRAREWYDHCRSFHPECVESADRILPTRLLNFSKGHLRLCNGADVDISTRYATLSHCWGNLPMFKLTLERLQSFKTKIEIKDLSRTFQDALRILAHLGLEFLWIDSLCIVQHDPSDWNRESLLMSSVYGCCDVTIAAASSTDDSQGCFYERKMPVEHLLHVRIEVTYQISQDVQSGDCKSFTITHPTNPEHEWLAPYTLINQSPLFSRGWVCQERNLTPRLLVFDSSYLFWECTEWSGPEWKTPAITGLDEPQDPHERVGQDFSWQHIVRVCSSSQLTFPSDKLVAISGIAKKIKECCSPMIISQECGEGIGAPIMLVRYQNPTSPFF
jgi:Heterokaryon incompatibility protein (HET)